MMQDYFRIVKIGSLWLPYIHKSRDSKVYVGEVVNVFRRTINIKTASNTLLSITSQNYFSPIYINIEGKDYLIPIDFSKMVRPYERVYINNGEVTINTISLKINEISGNMIYTPTICMKITRKGIILDNVDLHKLTKMLSKVSFIINIVEKPNNIIELVEKNNFMNLLEKLVNNIYGYLSNTLGEREVVDSIYSFLGLGFGYTPSSDDFISGLLGVLNLFLSYSRRDIIKLNKHIILTRTNWVSGNLVYLNHLGLFSSVFEEAVEALLMFNEYRIIDAFLSLLSIGHTSGFDMFIGALIASIIVYDYCNGTNMLKKFMNKIFS